MPKVLLARGARGELVRKIQDALTKQGFDPQGTDGKFGKATKAAVKAFQLSSSFEPTGRVDVGTWMALLNMPVPNTQERALQLTAAFEGHGFSLAQGNWDGAGITWGIFGFTLKHGELGKIILQVFDESPALVQQSFGANTEELIGGAELAEGVAEPWRSSFRTFGEIAEVQALQLAIADGDYGQPAAATAAGLGLETELGRALAFDIHVQDGGIKASAREEIEATLDEMTITTEQKLRVVIAHAVADASSSFQEDVRARKLTIATGAGKVHGETFALSNWGLDESLAD